MKYKVAPTQQERVMREDDFIISKTDLKGRLTYCNRIFIEFSALLKANYWDRSTTSSAIQTCRVAFQVAVGYGIQRR